MNQNSLQLLYQKNSFKKKEYLAKMIKSLATHMMNIFQIRYV